MNALGRHLMLELRSCNRGILDDLSFIRSALVQAAEACGATVLGESFHHFSPQGVSGTVIIAESHLCVHTWPEYGYAAVDIFTCGETIQPYKGAELLIATLGSKNPSIIEMRRGLLSSATGETPQGEKGKLTKVL